MFQENRDLGLYLPLNASNIGVDRFNRVKEALLRKDFLRGNKNALAKLIDLDHAKESLSPINEFLGFTPSASEGNAFGSGLAIRPFVLADIIEAFVRFTVPREQLGEASAPVQAMILDGTKAAILEGAGLALLPSSDPTRVQFEEIFTQVRTVVATSYSSYEAFRSALLPILDKAKKFPNLRGSGYGAFIPPHCYLVRAHDSRLGKSGDGLLAWEYIGHGFHANLVRPTP